MHVAFTTYLTKVYAVADKRHSSGHIFLIPSLAMLALFFDGILWRSIYLKMKNILMGLSYKEEKGSAVCLDGVLSIHMDSIFIAYRDTGKQE